MEIPFLSLIIKIVYIIFVAIFAIFAFVVTTQVHSLNKIVQFSHLHIAMILYSIAIFTVLCSIGLIIIGFVIL